ncbi:MAG: threonine ammonia-lyase [Solirubrobacterales bacterium]|nr:threonine ammonia-lyase [Solirubrobacterales bacterium]MBV9534390.1 threonine ammonia-lyase [Solirubrobacterales bacterium]
MSTGVRGPSIQDIERAATAGRGIVRETPVLSSRTLSERVGGTVVLKAENLQRTGSFKLRGAVAKISSLGDRCADGVVTGSAGNHAQAVAYAAGIRGLRCEVYMPETAATAKMDAAVALGADVQLVGTTVDECLDAAKERARTAGLEFIHPFDDPEVVAGQGTLGLELLAAMSDIERVVVPVGGGGLISGVAIALKAARPEVEVIGVQVDACAPFLPSLAAGEAVAVSSALTIADGIAVKRPGGLTLELVQRLVDEMVVVPEDDVAEAMVLLMERAKLVVEGAGAVGVAALLAGLASASGPGKTVAILSGGNVDAGILSQIARRHESLAGHRLVLLARIPDLPGALAGVLSLVAARGANLVDVQHIREGFDLHVRETAVQLVLETRGPEHAAEVSAAVREAGYSEPRLLKRGRLRRSGA